MKIRICIDGNIVTQPNKTTVYEIEQIHPDGSTSQVEAVSEREFNESVFLLARHQHQNQFYFNFYIDTNNIPRVSGYIISFYSESSIIKLRIYYLATLVINLAHTSNNMLNALAHEKKQ